MEQLLYVNLPPSRENIHQGRNLKPEYPFKYPRNQSSQSLHHKRKGSVPATLSDYSTASGQWKEPDSSPVSWRHENWEDPAMLF